MPIHFLSGLPRSGSTLLASLLNQHPDIHASIASAMGGIYTACHTAMGVTNESVDMMDDEQRINILRGLFYGFYRDTRKKTVFDNSRAWTARTGELFELLPQSKMVVMVRPLNEILNSFERVHRAEKWGASAIFGSGSNTTQRINTMMQAGGVVQTSYSNTKDAFFSRYTDRILFVRYSSLCSDTQNVIAEITQFCLGERWEDVDILSVKPIYDAQKFDMRLGMYGLHDLRPIVHFQDMKVLIPPDQWVAHSNSAFWDEPELNQHGMRVL